jgi:hypothetical protein
MQRTGPPKMSHARSSYEERTTQQGKMRKQNTKAEAKGGNAKSRTANDGEILTAPFAAPGSTMARRKRTLLRLNPRDTAVATTQPPAKKVKPKSPITAPTEKTKAAKTNCPIRSLGKRPPALLIGEPVRMNTCCDESRRDFRCSTCAPENINSQMVTTPQNGKAIAFCWRSAK